MAHGLGDEAAAIALAAVDLRYQLSWHRDGDTLGQGPGGTIQAWRCMGSYEPCETIGKAQLAPQELDKKTRQSRVV